MYYKLPTNHHVNLHILYNIVKRFTSLFLKFNKSKLAFGDFDKNKVVFLWIFNKFATSFHDEFQWLIFEKTGCACTHVANEIKRIFPYSQKRESLQTGGSLFFKIIFFSRNKVRLQELSPYLKSHRFLCFPIFPQTLLCVLFQKDWKDKDKLHLR